MWAGNVFICLSVYMRVGGGGGWVCLWRQGLLGEGLHGEGRPPERYGHLVVNTHPTGMHSCVVIMLFIITENDLLLLRYW